MPALEVAQRAASPAPAAHLLMPGQWYFGRHAGALRTLLGSCVGVTLWHPQRRLGGMCHYLLPRRPGAVARDARDGRFGNEAIEMMVEALHDADTSPQDYETHLYGGADVISDMTGRSMDIGARNIELGWDLLAQHGFQLAAVDVGDHVSRLVTLDLGNGEVTMKRGVRPC